MHTITLSTPKPGQGCTVTAVGLAAAFQRSGHTVTVYGNQDLPCAAGQTTVDDAPYQKLELPSDRDGHVLINDLGRVVDCSSFRGRQDDRLDLLVLRPCYMALRAAAALNGLADTYDGVLLVEETGRVLDAADVAAVVGLPVVATIPVTSTIARHVDAGLLLSRPEPNFDRVARQLVSLLDAKAAQVTA